MIRDPATRQFAIPARANAAIMACQLAALAGCFYAAARVDRWWSIAALAIGFGVLMNSVYSIIHEAEHAMLFPSRPWNDLAGVIMALFFPAPFHLIRQGHLGHHLRNRSDDEAFDLYFEDDHPIWRWLVLYGILTGCYWLIVVLSNLIFLVAPFAINKKYWQFDRPSEAFLESLNPRYGWLIQIEAASVILLHTLIIRAFGIPLGNYAIMYFGFGLTWSSMQYVHHFGTERHVTRGARDLWICGPLDAIWLNHNWHRAHHEHPTVPWTYLPELSSRENVQAQPGFLPLAYLRMWRGPRRASDHVQNKFSGQVLR